jgi:hypothetical protein
MDKQTEHQPLDDFFRRRMNEASVAPGTDTWNRLQSRMAQQKGAKQPTHRRISLIWYGTSAAVAACLLVIFFWKTQTDPSSEAGKRPQLAAKNPKISPNRVAVESTVQPTEQNRSATAQSVIKSENLKPVSESESVAESQSQTHFPQQVGVKSEQLTEIPVQLAQNPVIPSATETPNEAPTTTKPSLPASPVEAPSKVAPKTERTLVVSVEEPTQIQPVNNQEATETDVKGAKNGRLSRLFKQIKHLKGEEVYARVDFSQQETDEEQGVVDRLIHSTRSKDKEHKQQK